MCWPSAFMTTDHPDYTIAMTEGSDVALDVFSDHFFFSDTHQPKRFPAALQMCIEACQSILRTRGLEIDRNDLAYSFDTGPSRVKLAEILKKASSSELMMFTPDLLQLVLQESRRQMEKMAADLESILSSTPAQVSAAPIVDSLVSGPEEFEVIPGKPVRAYESIKEEDEQTYNLHRSTGVFVGTNSVNKRKLQVFDD